MPVASITVVLLLCVSESLNAALPSSDMHDSYGPRAKEVAIQS
jgi:hypothetical protein